MKFGINLYRFPQFGAEKPGSDLEGIVEYLRTAEDNGFDQVRFLDHVIGVVADRHSEVRTPYTADSNIHECFVLMGYLAAKTRTIRLATGVLVLPQRQTLLVAKQAAEVDILSGGRLTLGVGLGYNPVEFQAMEGDFSQRAARFEEQVGILRQLWTDEAVNYQSATHQLVNVSLAPRPIQRPIPLWLGVGRTATPIPPDRVLQRVGRLADGWFPMFQPGPEAEVAITKVRAAAADAGRDPDALEMDLITPVAGKSNHELAGEVRRRAEMGATRLTIQFPAESIASHIEGVRRFREVMDLVE